jgi:dolichyl-phosphate-mannose-protein mannosyltransferase
MERELFLHHYLPAFYFSALLFGITFDAIIWKSNLLKYLVMGLLVLVCAWSFVRFSPLTYGLEQSFESCQSLKWRSTWDVNCKNVTQNVYMESVIEETDD